MRLTNSHVSKLLRLFDENRHLFGHFMKGVADYFIETPIGKDRHPAVIQQVKCRLKDPEHLAEKIRRKWDPDDPILEENLFEKITDLAGVRIVYTAPSHFLHIHSAILEQIEKREWYFNEKPIVYCWDEEVKAFFKEQGLKSAKFKPSHYTSVHYVVRKNKKNIPICEIQTRSILEEVWGELDHNLNYPIEMKDEYKKERIKILAKILRAGEKTIDLIVTDR